MLLASTVFHIFCSTHSENLFSKAIEIFRTPKNQLNHLKLRRSPSATIRAGIRLIVASWTGNTLWRFCSRRSKSSRIAFFALTIAKFLPSWAVFVLFSDIRASLFQGIRLPTSSWNSADINFHRLSIRKGESNRTHHMAKFPKRSSAAGYSTIQGRG